EDKLKIIHMVKSEAAYTEFRSFIIQKDIPSLFSSLRNLGDATPNEELVKFLITTQGFAGHAKWEDLDSKAKNRLVPREKPQQYKPKDLSGQILDQPLEIVYTQRRWPVFN